MNMVYLFFNNIVSILIQRSCTYQLTFIPKCFKYFDAIVNGVLKILSSKCHQYEKNRIDICHLTLQLATLLNSLISSASGFTYPSEFSYTYSCHLQIKIVLLLSFQSLYFLFHLIALTGREEMRVDNFAQFLALESIQ